MDANQEVFDLSVRYAVFLERYKSGSVRRIQEFLLQLDRDTAKRLDTLIDDLSGKDRAAFARGKNATTKRLQALRDFIAEVTKSANALLQDRVVEEVTPLAERVTNRNAAIAAQVGIEASKPRISQIEALIRSEPFQGNVLKEWAKDWSEARTRRVTQQLRLGFAAGDTTSEIITRIIGKKSSGYKDGILSVSRRSADTIVRTASNHTRNVSDTEFAKANEDKIDYMLRRGVLDTRTSDVCRINDGRRYKVDEIEGVLPAHPNCRSQWITIYKGQGRPDDDDYFDWLKKQSREIQDEALGSTKAKLFREGGLKGGDLVNEATGKAYTLDELRDREASAFEKAGLGDE